MTSQSLANIQHDFWRALHNEKPIFIDVINSDNIFSSTDRINVYCTTARSLHVAVLASTYAVCEKILGKDYFRLIAKNYFIRHPSSSFDLNNYGEHFSEILSELIMKRDELKDYYYLAELARLEWAIQISQCAHDDEKLDMEEFRLKCELYGGNIRFTLMPSIFTLKTYYPVADIWNKHQSFNVANDVAALNECENLCIYRLDDKVKIEKIDVGVMRLISLINRNFTLEEIADEFGGSNVLDAALEIVMSRHWLRV